MQYTFDPTKLEWADYATVVYARGIVFEHIQKCANMLLVGETLSHSHLSSLSHCGLILALRVELV